MKHFYVTFDNVSQQTLQQGGLTPNPPLASGDLQQQDFIFDHLKGLVDRRISLAIDGNLLAPLRAHFSQYADVVFFTEKSEFKKFKNKSSTSYVFGIIQGYQQLSLSELVLWQNLGADGVILKLDKDFSSANKKQQIFARISELSQIIVKSTMYVFVMGDIEGPDVPRFMALGIKHFILKTTFGANLDKIDALGQLIESSIANFNKNDLNLSMNNQMNTKNTELILKNKPVCLDHKQFKKEKKTDLIFVKNLILPAFVGAYDFEREKTQKISFTVKVKIYRTLFSNANDMSQIFSYDLIIDFIKQILLTDHFEFVETLAEKIAQEFFKYSQVKKVQVKVKKIELEPQGVGIVIKRQRKDYENINQI